MIFYRKKYCGVNRLTNPKHVGQVGVDFTVEFYVEDPYWQGTKLQKVDYQTTGEKHIEEYNVEWHQSFQESNNGHFILFCFLKL